MSGHPKAYRSKNHQVVKYVHDDGSETVIKNTGGCDGTFKDKYTIFLSCSYGCQIKCKHCMLTTKDIKYKSLTSADIIDNAIAALQDFAWLYNPKVIEKSLKISWMGMGDATLSANQIIQATPVIADWAINNDHPVATGLDRVDIASSLPGTRYIRFFNGVQRVHDELRPFAPNMRSRYSRVKAFISILSAVPETRNFLIPNGWTFIQDLEQFQYLKYVTGGWPKENLVVHHLLLNDVNDSDIEVDAMVNLMTRYLPRTQLRLLRYNQCPGSGFEESPRFDEIAKRFQEELFDVKIQDSPGEEVMAACGQFMLGETK